MRMPCTLAVAVLLAVAAALPAAAQPADLIVLAGGAWTGDSAVTGVRAVATREGRIVAVGTHEDVLAHRGPETRVIEAHDRYLVPGFIDNHTHFASAGALLLGVNLLDVADADGLIRRVREARDRLPPGAWVTGGDWGAYEAWALSSTGDRRDAAERPAFRPDRTLIDSITPQTPVLLNRWDRSEYLANERALVLAEATCMWTGVECRDGRPTGRLTADAAARVRAVIPPKPLEQRLRESRAALEHLAEFGVTTIHDNTTPEQLEVFQVLRREGDLTVRIYARPTLDKWDELRAVGIRHGFGDDMLRIGGLKGFVDGIMGNSSARFYEPYRTTGVRGSWRDMMLQPPGMLELLLGADSAGHWPQVHAIGDEAIDTLLSMYEHVMRVNGPRERRFRVIHTQVMRGPEVAGRMARLGVIAEVQPYHAIDDMRWMEERIGERSRWAYAFRTLEDAGVLLSFGSDWPGTNASWYTADPLKGIYAAVTRQTLEGEPAAGWFPEERVSVETALRAYTVNNAFAEGTEDLKGRLRAGFLADFVLLDRNPFEVAPAALKDVGVALTVVGGRVVYEREPASTSAGRS